MMENFKVEHFIDLEKNPCWQVVTSSGQGIVSCATHELAKFVAKTLERKAAVERVLKEESARITRR